MKKIFLGCILIFAAAISLAQTKPVDFAATVHRTDNNGLYEIMITAQISDGWHLYGNNPNVDGLESVKFSFDDENAKLFNEAVFNIPSQTINDPIWENKKVNVYTNTVQIQQRVKISGVIPASLKLLITANVGKGKDEFQTVEQSVDLKLEGGVIANTNTIKLSSIDINHPLKDCGKKNDTKNIGFLSIFFLGFLGGLIALLTPCVFPMIPVTVSFFTKRAANKKQGIKNGVLYGLFIFII